MLCGTVEIINETLIFIHNAAAMINEEKIEFFKIT